MKERKKERKKKKKRNKLVEKLRRGIKKFCYMKRRENGNKNRER